MHLNETELKRLEYVRNHLSPGCVLTPDEVDAECATLNRPLLLNDYALYAEMPEHGVLPHEDASTPKAVRFSMFASPSDVMHAMVTLQTGAHQLRILLTLAEEKTRHWLEHAIAMQRIVLVTCIAETNQISVAFMRFVFSDVEHLRSLLLPQQVLDKETTSQDAAEMVPQLLLPETLGSSLPGYELQDVHVVMALDWLNRPVRSQVRERAKTDVH